jgi:uncharacterized phage protein (TIGR01671 family)
VREIKFRGKSLLDSKWYYGFYYNMDDSRIGERRHIIRWENNGPGRQNIEEPIDPKTLGQYIGIKDIYGKKVFRGDIVKVKEIVYASCYREEVGEIREFTGEVVWKNHGWHIAKKIENGVRYHSLWLWNIEDDSMEIIGNIYDNPELLKDITLEIEEPTTDQSK